MTITKVQLFSGGSTTALQRQINEFVGDKRDVLETKLHIDAANGLLIIVLHYVDMPAEPATNLAGDPV